VPKPVALRPLADVGLVRALHWIASSAHGIGRGPLPVATGRDRRRALRSGVHRHPPGQRESAREHAAPRARRPHRGPR
jgi:hypothetical protein